MIVTTDGFEFDFTDAIDAFIFDEKDKQNPRYYNAPMKAVDIIVELEREYLFIEIKDYDDLSYCDIDTASSDTEKKERQDSFRWLKNYLKYKYRDTFLYRFAEEKVDKPIHYLCLLNFDNAINTKIKKVLHSELPVRRLHPHWKKSIVESCQVVNFDKWNENFDKWQVKRIPTTLAP